MYVTNHYMYKLHADHATNARPVSASATNRRVESRAVRLTLARHSGTAAQRLTAAVVVVVAAVAVVAVAVPAALAGPSS